MAHIKFDYSTAKKFFGEHELTQLQDYVTVADRQLREGTGAGSDYTGWVTWPEAYDKEEFAQVQAAAEKIRQDSDVLVVIGIGGSYLGARAAIEFLNDSFYNMKAGRKGMPQVVFAGNSISSTYLHDLLDLIGDRDFSINVISKSGTTTEPAVGFRVLKEKLIAKYGKEEAIKRIYATTDAKRGALKAEANQEGYQTFVIPDAIGGRFTVLTPVGLLPIAVAGGDIQAMMQGAAAAMAEYSQADLASNQAYQYAAIRNILYRKGKVTELLVNYEPGMAFFNEWWKQLFGESEGKEHKGIFPASCDFTTDLHSMGQWIQEGERSIFETVISIEQSNRNLLFPNDEENLDGLNFLAGKHVDEVNKMAELGTRLAHVDGGVPNIRISVPVLNEYYIGQLIYFFEIACGISGNVLGVNPFNQPGVEAYKKNMFALLNKPGYEAESKAIQDRLK